MVTDDDPLDAMVTVVCADLRDTSVFASDLVLDLVSLAVLRVDRANQAVLRDVLEMTTVLEPGATSGDVVGRALALDLDEDGQVLGCLAVPRLEGLEQLEAVRLGVNGDLDGSTVRRRGLEGVLSGVVTLGRELKAVGVVEIELLAVRASELVSEGVEAEVAGKRECSDNVGGGDEGVGSGVGIVATSEVAVVRSDD